MTKPIRGRKLSRRRGAQSHELERNIFASLIQNGNIFLYWQFLHPLWKHVWRIKILQPLTREHKKCLEVTNKKKEKKDEIFYVNRIYFQFQTTPASILVISRRVESCWSSSDEKEEIMSFTCKNFKDTQFYRLEGIREILTRKILRFNNLKSSKVLFILRTSLKLV